MSQIATITFPMTSEQAINSSLQVGDIVYYSPTNKAPNSNISKTTTASIVKFGVVLDILSVPTRIKVVHELSTPLPAVDDYIMFEKDKQVNSSSLIGYYASVTLVNDSTDKVELFSLGSEVSVSSK